MKAMRRFFGVLVMLAGVLGLVLSLAGLVGVWVARPAVSAYAATTIDSLHQNVTASQDVMAITGEALGATVDSVDALSAMLSTTAATLEDTKPVLNSFDEMMATTLPSTLNAAKDSLESAQEAAQMLEGAIESLNTFRFLLSSAPLIGDLVGQPTASAGLEKPLAESLGELATSMEGLPETFTGIAASLSTTDDKLASVQQNLITMSDSVKRISSSLGEYQAMVTQSKSSMDSLTSMLSTLQKNLGAILNGAAIALTLFFAWLLAAQVVILSQGWEIYHGTADRMEQ